LGIAAPLVIIDNFNVIWSVLAPDEADPPLIVDPYGVLPIPIALQRVQPVARQTPENPKRLRVIKDLEPPLGLRPEGSKCRNVGSLEKRLSFFVSKGSDHLLTLSDVS
jgi:hypothetical protein